MTNKPLSDVDKRIAEDNRRIKEYEKSIARIPLVMAGLGLTALLLIWLFI